MDFRVSFRDPVYAANILQNIISLLIMLLGINDMPEEQRKRLNFGKGGWRTHVHAKEGGEYETTRF